MASFAFIDESVCAEANLVSLTTIIIPFDDYDKILTEYYSITKYILEKILKLPEDKIPFSQCLTLHGNNLLRNTKNENERHDFSKVEDSERLIVFEKIVELINKFNIEVIRVGYNNWKHVKQLLNDEKAYFFNWLAIAKYLSNHNENEKFICVMDGTNASMIKEISQMIINPNKIRNIAPQFNESIAITNSQNFLGNVFYTPAKYSEFVQIVDIISYILQKRDYIKITGKIGLFSNEIAKIADNLDHENLINKIVSFNTYGL